MEESSAAVLFETALVSGRFTLSVFSRLPGTTSENVRAGPRAEHPKRVNFAASIQGNICTISQESRE